MNNEPFLPYGRQQIDDDDIEAVAAVLRSDWLTTGPKVGEFERAFADFCGTREAVAVNSGTAALHCLYHAAGISEGDEVIVPALTFAATANAVLYCGAKPVFADVEPDTLLIDPESVRAKITPRTKAIVSVDYAGHGANYVALRDLAAQSGALLFSDACHALGGSWHGEKIGQIADASTFSLHPVKPMTTGEGGMITTDNSDWAAKMRVFRNHGITSDHRARERAGSWFYEMVELGFNYRLSDIACALGLSQLPKIPAWTKKRQHIAALYDAAFADFPEIEPLRVRDDISHAYHLYVVQLRGKLEKRAGVFAHLRERKIGVNVHYVPVHLHPFYRENLGTKRGDCPTAEAAYERILSLPMFPAMGEEDVARVVRAFSALAEK